MEENWNRDAGSEEMMIIWARSIPTKETKLDEGIKEA